MAHAKGLIRDECVEEGVPLDDSEKLAVEKESIDYYQTNWHRLIMPFLRFK